MCKSVKAPYTDALHRPLDEPNAAGWTPLMYAAYYGHSGCVALLLHCGAAVSRSTAEGHTPLMLATRCGELEALALLLEVGAL